MSEPKVVYGVWEGRGNAELSLVFATREAAERYVADYNRHDVASMMAFFAKEAERAEAEGEPERAAYYRAATWEPQAEVGAITVHDTPEAADPHLYRPEPLTE